VDDKLLPVLIRIFNAKKKIGPFQGSSIRPNLVLIRFRKRDKKWWEMLYKMTAEYGERKGAAVTVPELSETSSNSYL